MWLLYKVFGTKAIQIYIFYGCVCVKSMRSMNVQVMGLLAAFDLVRCRHASQHVALQHTYSAVEQRGGLYVYGSKKLLCESRYGPALSNKTSLFCLVRSLSRVILSRNQSRGHHRSTSQPYQSLRLILLP